MADHEAVLAVIALGVPEHPPALPVQRRRKSLEKLCKGELSLWPAELRQVAACVREAPSAMNLQPWTMSFTASRFEIDSGDRSALDLGIALCHAEAALKTPHHWYFAQNRRDPAAWAEFDQPDVASREETGKAVLLFPVLDRGTQAPGMRHGNLPGSADGGNIRAVSVSQSGFTTLRGSANSANQRSSEFVRGVCKQNQPPQIGKAAGYR